MIEKISIIGLGKLGASMAAAFASRDFEVIGVDVNRHFVEQINQGKAPVQETNLERYIGAHREKIKATTSHEEAVLNSDVSFVIVPTPSDERGAFSLQYAAWALSELGKALRKKSSYHNIVLTSTVLPGSMRQILLPILERESGKKAGRDFGLCYSPEFIALGSIIDDFLHPDFTLIGELDDKCGAQLEEIYSRVVVNEAKSARMSLENAELTKISINTYITTKITFANMLAEICEKLPGGDVDVVTNALGLDKRIGRRYLTGAIGYGGPCFPRDNVALSFIAGQLGVKAEIAETTDSMNRAAADKIVKKIRPLIRDGATVAVLGLAYKPFSHVTEESQGVYLAEKLSQSGLRIVAYDPLAEKMELDKLRRQILIAGSIEECLKEAEAVIITTPDPEFARLDNADFDSGRAKILIVDFWRILRGKLDNLKNIEYLAVGCGENTGEGHRRLKNIWANPESENFQTSGG